MNFNFIGDIFFPPACVGCGDSIARGVLCDTCRKGIDMFDTLFCGTCSARLPEQKKICHKDAPYLLGAAGQYDDGALRALIHALKFQGIAGAAEPLAGILVEYVARLDLDLKDFTVMPVPLSTKRARARGFNQSALIARPFAETLGLPFDDRVLTRVEHRKPQSETEDIFERRENIRGCFALADGAEVQGKKVILIDDVTTSGTTFNEAAHVLKTGGAKKILALAVAKA
ncbi:MAG TPA: ComF family protein [Candidatus Paceibacterota bacterium]|nr:ComF family protein [Candidatus Paceibacterota bacterium]